MRRSTSIFVAVLVGALGIARADVYRWVDDHGVPHYSDQWVPGSEIIKTARGRPLDGAPSPSANQKSLVAQGNAGIKQLDNQANAEAVQADVSRARDAQCAAAKDRYVKAVSARRVFKEGQGGDREYLTDAEADAYREAARKDVQDRCGSVPQYDPNAPIPEPQPVPEPKPIPEPKVTPQPATSP
jgi:hypothetical protein